MEKERKTHLNKVYESIVDEPRFYDWGRQAVEGMTDVSWTKKKSKLQFLTIKKMAVSQKFDNTLQFEQSLMSLHDTTSNKI